jgi:hypothetical protein
MKNNAPVFALAMIWFFCFDSCFAATQAKYTVINDSTTSLMASVYSEGNSIPCQARPGRKCDLPVTPIKSGTYFNLMLSNYSKAKNSFESTNNNIINFTVNPQNVVYMYDLKIEDANDPPIAFNITVNNTTQKFCFNKSKNYGGKFDLPQTDLAQISIEFYAVTSCP